MEKKFSTMAESVEYSIRMIKDILEHYDTRRSLIKDKEELADLEDKRAFMQEQLEEQEKLYIKYTITNEPYIETNTYEYFKKHFTEKSCDREFTFVSEVISFADDNIKPSQKVKILKELIKAYKDTKDDN